MSNQVKRRRWVSLVLVLVAAVAAPIAGYEITLLVTGSHSSARHVMREVVEGLGHGAQTWVLLELFFMVKMRRLSSLLREPPK